ncbi:MAG: bcp [Chlamydiales bacterium]|jgi:peroxiredoxin Q/BCP|nr:bcp [Chlamydiales bacterium]
MLQIGDAPSFTLHDAQGQPVSLSHFKGQFVVVYFYPKDDTPGCTLEGIEFTKALADFTAMNAVVLGISRDSEKSHCHFKDKYDLKHPLLSDPEAKVAKAFGAFGIKKMYGKEYEGVIRATFLIDREGKVCHIWPNVSPKGHVQEVIEQLKRSL